MSDPLESLRSRIDELDHRLIEALAERQHIVAKIAGLKADPALPLQDAERERDLLSRVSALASAQGLDSYFVESLYRRILEHSVRFQAARQDNEGRGAGPVVAYQGVEVPIVTLLREVTSPRPRAKFNSTATDHSQRLSKRWYVARRRWPS